MSWRHRDHTRGSLVASIGVLAPPTLLASLAGGVVFQLVDLTCLSRLGGAPMASVINVNQSLRQILFMRIMGSPSGPRPWSPAASTRAAATPPGTSPARACCWARSSPPRWRWPARSSARRSSRCPALGVRGAALGLACGQTLALVIALAVLFRGASRVHLRARHLRPDPAALRRIVWLATGRWTRVRAHFPVFLES